MQKFLVAFGDPSDHGHLYLTGDVIKHALKLVGHTEFTVTEIPQPPFPTGMDKNLPYQEAGQ